jgi:peptidoglycan/xylan/chitin deacetylase (PgdA/CDA1 family)
MTQWAAAGAAAGLMVWAVRGRSSAVFGPSVYRGSRSRPAIALTFDDGPSESTPAILEILAKYSVRATFFQCGANALRLPAIGREVAAAGHEIGNHSHTHAPLYLKPARFIAAEFGHAQDAIGAATGFVPRLLRAPYGARWFGFAEAQRRLHLLGVMWTVLALDWKLPAGRVAGRVLRGASNGGIICLHDGRELRSKPDIRTTIGAVARVIPRLEDRGYKFETVSELLCPKN